MLLPPHLSVQANFALHNFLQEAVVMDIVVLNNENTIEVITMMMT